MGDTRHCLLDTNIFLHFQAFDQIKWSEELGAASVTLVICSTVLKELEDKKRESPDRKIRERARKVITKLGDYYKTGRISLPNNTQLHFITNEPDINWCADNLDPNVSDDRILASALSVHRRGEDVVVATDDSVLGIKAGERGLKCYFPDKDRLGLPETKTPEEIQVEQQLRRLRDLEERRPLLKFGFIENGEVSRCKKCVLTRALCLTQEQVKEILERKKSELKMALPESIHDAASSFLGMAPILRLVEPSREQIAKYNKAVDKYVDEDFRSYLKDKQIYERWHSRSPELRLALKNKGNIPAEDIDIELHFPDGMAVAEPADIPMEPKPPSPPAEPTGPMGAFQWADHISGAHLRPNLAVPSRLLRPPDVTGPNVRNTESYQVTYWIRKLKQSMLQELDSVYVTYPSVEDAFSFSIDYSIISSSIPGEHTCTINVIVSKEERS